MTNDTLPHMSPEYDEAITTLVTAIRRALALRLGVPSIATVPITAERAASLRHIAERAVAMVDYNTLRMAKARAIEAVIEDDDLPVLGAFVRKAIDAYEARVR